MTNKEKIKTFCLNSAANLCDDMNISVKSVNELEAFREATNLLEQLTRIAKMADEISEGGGEV